MEFFVWSYLLFLPLCSSRIPSFATHFFSAVLVLTPLVPFSYPIHLCFLPTLFVRRLSICYATVRDGSHLLRYSA
jgi:hypothetical protein